MSLTNIYYQDCSVLVKLIVRIYFDFFRNTKLNIDEKRSSPEIARSQKIENLIKKVAENKSSKKARLSSRIPAQPQNNLQV